MSRAYEGIRYSSEKQIVVLDIGAAYTKFGYAGEVTPRGIVKTEVKCPEANKVQKIFKCHDTNDLYQLLVEFLHAIFFKHVVITPKDVKMIILESLLTPTKFRDTLAKVLFRHFEVGSLMFLPTHLATISTLGWDTALVLDIGYQEATIIPIYKGVPILKAWQSLPLAGEAVEERIRNDFKTEMPDVDFEDRIIEDIKVRTCFVTTLERSKKLGTDNAPSPPPTVKYPGTKTINIPGYIRERAFELFWERDADNLSVSTMVLDAILKCSILARVELAENILLMGGTTMSKGFAARLKSELLALVNSELYSEKLKIRKFKFHTAPCKANYTAWLGGAIFGVADLPARYITKDTYLKINRIPDWVNLMDNQKELESNYGI